MHDEEIMERISLVTLFFILGAVFLVCWLALH